MRNLHEVLTVRCAHCGKLRQEDSHWFAVTAVEGKFLCTPLGNTVECTGISSFAHRERRLRRNQQPACGRLCAQRLFEQYLAAEASRRHANTKGRWSAREIE